MTLPTVIVAAVAVMALGCVRGPAATTAMVENTTVTPASVKARISAGEVTVLWRDISVYRASAALRLAGSTYEVTSHHTKTECEVAQQAAMTRDALSRVGPKTEQLSDGIFRYLCRLAGAGPAPFR